MIDALFCDYFGSAPDKSSFTPGRANLIGEHTDYNGGMVLPIALPLGISIGFSARDDSLIKIISDRFPDPIDRKLSDAKHNHWSDYAVGAVRKANENGFLHSGANLAIHSEIPDGAGLSSSAALIVGILKAARDLACGDESNTDIAVMARKVENDYLSIPCGIMDQIAVAATNPGQAMALDTKSLSFDLIDLPSDYHMAVVHSGFHRKLSDGRYAARKAECDEASRLLGTPDLCLIDDAILSQVASLREPLDRRAKHCVTEHRRTIRAAAALHAGDLQTFGSLMNESHISMRDDFETSIPEIDALVESAIDFGAVGARLTGGGFGGCIVACVENAHLPNWKERLLTKHANAQFIV